MDVNANEKADCTADDFATGLEWVLNFHKNESVNTSMPIEMIKGAEEYYQYTKTLSEEEARVLTAGEGSKFLEMVGMEIVDKNNIIYHCVLKSHILTPWQPLTVSIHWHKVWSMNWA